MATTKNKNLFYQLYSKNNNVANSGYACTSTINEEDTSFDISGSEGQITDSNGNILASIDLSTIHAAGITQHTVETKILQPHSAYLLQGNEYGETYKSQFFLISDIISSIEDYESYCNIGFDILYKQNNKICNVHVESEAVRETYGTFVNLVQNQLNKLKVPVSISIKSYDDTESSNKQIDYINFQSTEEGYDFIVRNVKIIPILRNDENNKGEIGEFADSPFVEPIVTKDFIISLLEKYKPRLVGDKTDNSKLNNYKINCDVYREFLKLSDIITDDFNTFVYEIDVIKRFFLPCFEQNGVLIFSKKFNDIIIQKYPQIYQKYFTKHLSLYNIYDIVKVLDAIKDFIFKMMNSVGPSNCYEDLNRRIGNVKYPNGAMRGIVLIPNWPNDEEYDSNVLWVNHVADQLEVCVPVSIERLSNYYEGNIISKKKAMLFEKALASVQINALIPEEKRAYIEDYDNLPLNDISSNDGFTNSFDNLYIPAYDTDWNINDEFYRLPASQEKRTFDDEPIKYHDPDMYIDANRNSEDNDLWENNPNKTNVKFVDSHDDTSVKCVIGLYKYMEYLSSNDLWLRIGDGYMIIGKNDDKQLKAKNLLQSLLVYNPNEIPIKIKYIIFS